MKSSMIKQRRWLAVYAALTSIYGSQSVQAWAPHYFLKRQSLIHTNTANSFCAITTSTTFTSSRKLSSLHGTNGATTPSADSSMSKIESSGVKRFTIGYDKLCKNCPTRLQPRVDTLTEMILGLPDTERDELMRNVAKRLLETQNHQEEEMKKVVSSRDVYEFQTSGAAVKPEKQKPKREKDRSPSVSRPASATVREEADHSKLSKKMDKARLKYDSNKQNAARASRLLDITRALLSPTSQHAKELSIGTADNGWYHDIDRLMQLSRADLKMESLKQAAQKAKYEQKVAKQRMKLYGASMSLASINKKEVDATTQESVDQLQLLH